MHCDLQHQSCVVLFIHLHYPAALGVCQRRVQFSVWERADTVLPRPLSHWCMAANYSDKSLTLLLLPATPMHLMRNEREGGRGECAWCSARSLVFVISSCPRPSGRPPRGKLDVLYLQLSRCRYKYVRAPGEVTGVNFLYHSVCYYTDNVSVQRFCQMLQLWAICNSQRNGSEDWDDFEETEERRGEDGRGRQSHEVMRREGGEMTGREADWGGGGGGRTGKWGEAERESRWKRWREKRAEGGNR